MLKLQALWHAHREDITTSRSLTQAVIRRAEPRGDGHKVSRAQHLGSSHPRAPCIRASVSGPPKSGTRLNSQTSIDPCLKEAKLTAHKSVINFVP